MTPLETLRARGLTVTKLEQDGAVRLSLTPRERVDESALAFAKEHRDAIIAALSPPEPPPPDAPNTQRQGAWAFLTATVYEMAEGWDSLPAESRTPQDFEQIMRALDEWTLTYATGAFWPFHRQHFDATGARFRQVCRDVMANVLMRPVLADTPPHERLDALTLLEEHSYFDPKVPPPPIPSGLSSGTGPPTSGTVMSAPVATSRSSYA